MSGEPTGEGAPTPEPPKMHLTEQYRKKTGQGADTAEGAGAGLTKIPADLHAHRPMPPTGERLDTDYYKKAADTAKADTDQPSSIDELLTPTPAQAAEEEATKYTGIIPDRYRKIENFESVRMRRGLEAALRQKAEVMTDDEIEERRKTADRYMQEQLIPPSVENGPYAAAHWRSLYEMADRVVNRDEAAKHVPDVDPRISFSSSSLERRAIVDSLLIGRIQGALGEDALTRDQLRNCFTNVSQRQLDVVTGEIARSGLPLFPESPKEHWARIVRENPSGSSVNPEQPPIDLKPIIKQGA